MMPSFAGKNHSAESIEAMKANMPHSKGVRVTEIFSGNVKTFLAISAAALEYKVDPGTIRNHLDKAKLLQKRFRVESIK